MVFNPERAAARDISRMVRFPQAAKIEILARGRVELVEIRITNRISIVGMKIKEIAEKISSSILIGAIVRNDEIIIPKGDFRIEEDDIVHIVGKPAIVSDFCRQIGIDYHKIKNVMIAGGGRITYYLAKFLEETGIKAKIVEINQERCIELSELLPHALIINGMPRTIPCFILKIFSKWGICCVNRQGRENFMSALMAKNRCTKVIAKITRNNYISIIKALALRISKPKSIVQTIYLDMYVE